VFAWTGDDLIGGDPALDVVNTVGGAGKDRHEKERLATPAAAWHWGWLAGLLDAAEAEALARRSPAAPDAAAAALAALVDFREALHALLLTRVRDAIPDARDPDARDAPSRPAVEAAVRAAIGRATLAPAGAALAWQTDLGAADLELLRDRAALAAHRLLTSAELARVRVCARCSWMFIDRSRGRGRRWCAMAACGNRAKAQRHHRRAHGRRA
jgi:predicted RNA-binding Zn ribbon-like protein